MIRSDSTLTSKFSDQVETVQNCVLKFIPAHLSYDGDS